MIPVADLSLQRSFLCNYFLYHHGNVYGFVESEAQVSSNWSMTMEATLRLNISYGLYTVEL